MNTHGICVQARHEPCTVCHAHPGQACVARCPGVHVCRVCLAAHHQRITMRDEVSVLHDRDVYTGADFILDEVSA